ncbi:MAG: fructosamine kinase family protein [Nocardioides sp.]
MGAIAQRAEALLGTAVAATSPVAGGDVCTSTRLRLADGRSAVIKTRSQAPPGFFAAEADGLRWLGEATGTGGVDVPEVLAVEDDCLVLAWVESAKPSIEAAERFGRSLAATHAAGAPCHGSLSGEDTFIATLPLPQRTAGTWPEFFATRRLLPYLKLARDRGRISPVDGDAVDHVVRRIAELAGPDEPVARVHGDLWAGNLLWAADARTWLIDPAAHGGHRESDLAMLALFGCPQLPRVLDAYAEASALADGWEDRVGLHQLFPLLVHACLFGGSYGPRAGEAARALR